MSVSQVFAVKIHLGNNLGSEALETGAAEVGSAELKLQYSRGSGGRQEGQSQVQPAPHSNFQASLCYVVRQKKKKKEG